MYFNANGFGERVRSAVADNTYMCSYERVTAGRQNIYIYKRKQNIKESLCVC